MATRFALMIEPTASDDIRSDYTSTLTRVDATAPALSVGELSTQRGDGIFESIGVVDGHPQEVEAHLERFVRSAEICDLPIPNVEQWRQAIAAAAALCGPGGVGRQDDPQPRSRTWADPHRLGDGRRRDGLHPPAR